MSKLLLHSSEIAQLIKNLPGSTGATVSIPESGRSLGEGNGSPLQYSCLENPMDGGAWWASVHGVARSQTRLSFTFTFHFHALEKEVATHSSVLAWRIPGMGEPGAILLFTASDLASITSRIHSWVLFLLWLHPFSLLPSCSRQEGLFPCFVWKGFPAFPAHLRMRPVSRGNSRRATWAVSQLPTILCCCCC